MAAPIHIQVNATAAVQNVANLTGQVNNFALALSRVDASAHRIFAGLSELSQRYQRTGFLGQQDQRTLERGLGQWQRASQILDNRLRGAQGRLDYAQATSVGTRQDAIRIAQAAGALAQLRQRQGAMGTLEQALANLMAGPVPASPLQAAQMAAGVPLTPLASGRFSPFTGPAPAAGPGRSARGHFYGPGFGPGDLSGYESAARAGRSPRGKFYGPGFGPDDLSGLQGSGLQQPPSDGGGGGFLGTLATMGAGGARLLGRVARPLQALGGLAVGFSAVQQISQAMQAYEDRHLGILRVGRQLDEQYGAIDETLKTLQHSYQVTAREGVAAMATLGRVTGSVALASASAVQAVRVGRAYGMAPEAAAQMQAQFTMYSPNALPNPVALAGVYEQARSRGELSRMSFGRFGTEAATIAGIGGFGRAMVGEEEAGVLTRMMAGFGGRYAANPAAAFGEYYGRQQAPKSVIGEALNYEAVAKVMRDNPQGVVWSGGMLRPGASWMQQQILMTEGADIPQYRAAQFAVAQQRGGGNRDLAMWHYAQMTNAPTPAQALREYETLERQAAPTGGIVGAFQAPGAAGTGEAAIAARERRPYRPGQDILEREMTSEELAQTGLIRLLEDARTQMLKTIQDTALAFNSTETSAQALGKIFGDLGTSADKVKAIFEAMAVIPGLGWIGTAGALGTHAVQHGLVTPKENPIQPGFGLESMIGVPYTQPRRVQK